MTRSFKIFTLIFIILISFSIRLYLIRTSDPAADEIWSTYLMKNNLSDIWTGAFADQNGPLYFLFVRMLSDMLHVSITVEFLRILSLIFGTAVSVGAYLLASMLLNKKISIAVLLLGLFLPSFVWISVFGRYYALLALLTIIVLLTIMQYAKKKEKKYLLLYIAASTLGLYTHFYFIFTILSISIFFMLKKPFLTDYKRLSIPFIAILTLFSPGLYSFIVAPRWQNMNIRNDLVKIPAVLISNISSTQTLVFLQHNLGFFYTLIFTVLLLLTIILMSSGIIFMKNKSLSQLSLLLILFPIAAAVGISYMIHPMFSTNAFLIFLPIQTIVLAYGIIHFMNKRIYIVITFFVLVAITYIPFIQSFTLNRDFAKPFRYVKKRLEKGDVTVNTNIYLFVGARYYLGDGMHYALIPSITNSVTEKTHGYRPIELKNVPVVKRVWYFEPWFYNIDSVKRVKNQLDKTFHLVRKKEFFDNGVIVYLYEIR